MNFKTEARHIFQEKTDNVVNRRQEYIHTDFSLIAAKKVGIGNKLSVGFLARVRPNDIHKRFIQQYTLVRNYDGYRMAHRFASDQTLEIKNRVEVRFRYRTTFEIPLQGKSVDFKEFYLKVNHEILNRFENNSYDLGLRVIPLLGYKYTDKSKLEFGLDYRLNSFLKSGPNHTSWVSINWYLKI